MAFRLRDELSFCIADERAVFFDLRNDRYFRLDAAKEDAFRKLLAHQPTSAMEEQALRKLVEAGVLQESCFDSGLRCCAAPAAPTTSLVEAVELNPRITLLPLAIWKLASATSRRGSKKDLGSTLKRLGHQKANVESRGIRANPDDMRAIASTFYASFRVVRLENQCLWRSIALMQTMLCFGHAPTLVVGVTGRPFGAHCWVQNEDMVLNDRLDNVLPYTSILVI